MGAFVVMTESADAHRRSGSHFAELGPARRSSPVHLPPAFTYHRRSAEGRARAYLLQSPSACLLFTVSDFAIRKGPSTASS